MKKKPAAKPAAETDAKEVTDSHQAPVNKAEEISENIRRQQAQGERELGDSLKAFLTPYDS